MALQKGPTEMMLISYIKLIGNLRTRWEFDSSRRGSKTIFFVGDP